MAENVLIEQWLSAARQGDYIPGTDAQFAATMTVAEGIKWIGEQLAELIAMVKEDEKGADVNQ